MNLEIVKTITNSCEFFCSKSNVIISMLIKSVASVKNVMSTFDEG